MDVSIFMPSVSQQTISCPPSCQGLLSGVGSPPQHSLKASLAVIHTEVCMVYLQIYVTWPHPLCICVTTASKKQSKVKITKEKGEGVRERFNFTMVICGGGAESKKHKENKEKTKQIKTTHKQEP